MHTSNLLSASRGLEMPKQVTATTLTCSNLFLISSTVCTFVSAIEISVKKDLFKNYDKLKGRVQVVNWQT
jgi:ribosomal protein L31